MSVLRCILCNKKHDASSWKYREWDTQHGRVLGWACDKWFKPSPYPEFVSEKTKKDREKYAPDMVQRYREGELSREFVELYPEQTKGMVKSGTITKEQVKNSKYVWKKDMKLKYKPKADPNKLADEV